MNNPSNPKKFTSDTSTFKLSEPQKGGYIFKGWYSDSKFKTKITKIEKGTKKNITLYAKWQEVVYNIKFDANGGKGSKIADIKNVKSSKKVKLPANKYTKKGYTFIGWALGEKNGSIFDEKKSYSGLADKNGTITFYAVWGYKINYKLNGGTIGTKLNNYSSNYTWYLPEPTKKGYYFAGWFTDKKLTKRKFILNKGTKGNLTLYAKWSKKKRDNLLYSIQERLDSGSVFSYKRLYNYNIQFYSKSDVKYALDNLKTNWKKNALTDAKYLVNNLYLSEDGLYSELINKYSVYLYTKEEANYAVKQLKGKVDYKKNALKYANKYLETNYVSWSKLRRVLIEGKFNEEQINYALKNVKTNYKKNALESLKQQISGNAGFSKYQLEYILKDEMWYTDEEVKYAFKNVIIDFKTMAKRDAKSIMSAQPNYTYYELYYSLLNDAKFTEEEALYGVKKCGIDWAAKAYECAKSLYKNNKNIGYAELFNEVSWKYNEKNAKAAIDKLNIDWNKQLITYVENEFFDAYGFDYEPAGHDYIRAIDYNDFVNRVVDKGYNKADVEKAIDESKKINLYEWAKDFAVYNANNYNYSKKEILDEFNKYDACLDKHIEYAFKNANINFKDVALKRVNLERQTTNSESYIRERMQNAGFTQEEIDYGIANCELYLTD